MSRIALSVFVLVLSLPGALEASPIRWDFHDVRFDDGGTLTGYFIADITEPGHSISRAVQPLFSMTTSDGAAMSSHLYDSDLPYRSTYRPVDVPFVSSVQLWSYQGRPGHVRSGDRILFISFMAPLTDTGGVIDIHIDDLGEVVIAPGLLPFRKFVSGQIIGTPTSVPEPPIVLIIAISAAVLLPLRRRRFRGWTGRLRR